MKKLLSILSTAAISASASVSSVSCTSPYRYWDSFSDKLKNEESFIVCYHTKNEEKYTKLFSDLKIETTVTDANGEKTTKNYFNEELSKYISIYNGMVENYDANNSPEYESFGYGKKINGDLSNIIDWSVSKPEEMWQEWWSKKVWSWMTSSLVNIYYKNTYVDHNSENKNAFMLSEKYVDKYISSSLGNTNTSPILMLIRNGKFLGFLNYDKDVKIEAPKYRVENLLDQINLLINDADIQNTFLTNVNKANPKS